LINESVAGDLKDTVQIRFEAVRAKNGGFGEGLLRFVDKKGAVLATIRTSEKDYLRLQEKLNPDAVREDLIKRIEASLAKSKK
jgi:hypothetical protein